MYAMKSITVNNINQPGIKLYSINQVSDTLGVGRLTVHRLLKQGSFKTVRVGRSVRIPESSILDFINNGGNRHIDLGSQAVAK
jgi:excisionase family DNA binding protein